MFMDQSKLKNVYDKNRKLILVLDCFSLAIFARLYTNTKYIEIYILN